MYVTICQDLALTARQDHFRLSRSATTTISCRSDLNPLEEKYKLELEENHGIDAGASHRGVAISYQFPDERKVDCGLQAAVEVIFGDEFFERKVWEWGEIPFFGAHHVGYASYGEASREVNVTGSSRISSSGKRLTRGLFQHAGSFLTSAQGSYR